MNSYIRTGRYPNYTNESILLEEKKNYYFDDVNFTINGLCGFRLNPKNYRIGHELKLLDFSVVPNRRGNVAEVTLIVFCLLFRLK